MHCSAYLRPYSVIYYRSMFLTCLACLSSLTLESNSPRDLHSKTRQDENRRKATSRLTE
jgi:hypothetical protein